MARSFNIKKSIEEVFEKAPFWVLKVDDIGNILFANQAISEFFRRRGIPDLQQLDLQNILGTNLKESILQLNVLNSWTRKDLVLKDPVAKQKYYFSVYVYTYTETELSLDKEYFIIIQESEELRLKQEVKQLLSAKKVLRSQLDVLSFHLPFALVDKEGRVQYLSPLFIEEMGLDQGKIYQGEPIDIWLPNKTEDFDKESSLVSLQSVAQAFLVSKESINENIDLYVFKKRNKEMEDLRKEVEKLQAEKNDLEKTKDSLLEENSAIKAEREDLKARMKEQMQKVQELLEEVRALKEKYSHFRKRNEELEKEIQQVRAEKNELAEEVQKVHKELAQARKEQKSVLSKYKEKLLNILLHEIRENKSQSLQEKLPLIEAFKEYSEVSELWEPLEIATFLHNYNFFVKVQAERLFNIRIELFESVLNFLEEFTAKDSTVLVLITDTVIKITGVNIELPRFSLEELLWEFYQEIYPEMSIDMSGAIIIKNKLWLGEGKNLKEESNTSQSFNNEMASSPLIEDDPQVAESAEEEILHEISSADEEESLPLGEIIIEADEPSEGEKNSSQEEEKRKISPKDTLLGPPTVF